MKRPYHNPRNLPPSARLLLAAHQAAHDFSHIGDLSDLLARVVAGRVEIDTSPAACHAVLRALQEADDRLRGVARLWVDDLITL